MKGERRFDEQQVAMATVNIRVFERDPSRGPPIAATIGDALHQSAEVFGTSVATIICLVTGAAPWAVTAVLAWWLWVRSRRTPPRVPIA